MTHRDTKDYLQDILKYAKEAVEFTDEITSVEFKKDKRTINAVTRSLEIVGEAARKIPSNFREQHKSIPWKQIVGMRDKLVHDYTGVDLDTVWKTARHFAPKLIKEIEKII
jgi:uncharacterized protein with HEPN domain